MDMFLSNLGAFTETLGVENAPIVLHLSMVPWPDETTRDGFIKALTNVDMSGNF